MNSSKAADQPSWNDGTTMITLEIPQDNELLAAVGKVALRHGQLDYVLRMTIKSIESLTVKEALDATERQGSRELRERVRKLARQKMGEGSALVRLDAILGRARRATDHRNELIHNLWAYDKDAQPIIRDDDCGWQPVPNVQALDAVAQELASIASDLNDARLNGFLREALTQRPG